MTNTTNTPAATPAGIDLDKLQDKLTRVSRWIDKFPVPTDGATAMICHLRDVSEELARRAAQPVVAKDELHIGVANNDQGVHVNIIQRHADGTATVIYSAKAPTGDSYGRASLAQQVAAQPAPLVGWRDKLRWSKANTDYHSLIAFTPAQLEHFVSMLTAHSAPAVQAPNSPEFEGIKSAPAAQAVEARPDRAHFEQLAQQCSIYTCGFARYDDARAAHENKDRSPGDEVAVGDYVSRTLQNSWKMYLAASPVPAQEAAHADEEDHPALVECMDRILTPMGWTKYDDGDPVRLDREACREIFKAGQAAQAQQAAAPCRFDGNGCGSVGPYCGKCDLAAPVAAAAPADLTERQVADMLANSDLITDRAHITLINGDPIHARLELLTRFANHARAVAAAAPADDAKDAQTQAARDVLAERRRQIEQEGWTPEHDDMHGDGQMAVAAGYYALACGYPHERSTSHVPNYWPWAPSWWKPRDKRGNLVRAGALVLAEIERLDRAAMSAAQQEGDKCA